MPKKKLYSNIDSKVKKYINDIKQLQIETKQKRSKSQYNELSDKTPNDQELPKSQKLPKSHEELLKSKEEEILKLKKEVAELRAELEFVRRNAVYDPVPPICNTISLCSSICSTVCSEDLIHSISNGEYTQECEICDRGGTSKKSSRIALFTKRVLKKISCSEENNEKNEPPIKLQTPKSLRRLHTPISIRYNKHLANQSNYSHLFTPPRTFSRGLGKQNMSTPMTSKHIEKKKVLFSHEVQEISF